MPFTPGYYITKANKYIQEGNFAKAKKFAIKAIKVNPGNTQYYFLLILILFTLKEYDEALLYCKKVLPLCQYLLDKYSIIYYLVMLYAITIKVLVFKNELDVAYEIMNECDLCLNNYNINYGVELKMLDKTDIEIFNKLYRDARGEYYLAKRNPEEFKQYLTKCYTSVPSLKENNSI